MAQDVTAKDKKVEREKAKQKDVHLGTYHWWEERKWQRRNIAARLWTGFNFLINRGG